MMKLLTTWIDNHYPNIGWISFHVVYGLLLIGIISACSKQQIPIKQDKEAANIGDANGYTPLIRASWQGDLTQMDYWLRKGAHINESDHAGMTPIMHTVLQCELEAFRLLERRGAELSTIDVAGRSALHHAARGGCRDLLRYLYRNGNLLDGADQYGRTPLMVAAGNHHAESVRVLLDMGAQPSMRDHKGQTALHHAIQRFGRQQVSRKSVSHAADQIDQSGEQDPANLSFFQRIKRGFRNAGTQSLEWIKNAGKKIGKGIKNGAKASWAYITRPPWKPKEIEQPELSSNPPPVTIGTEEEGERVFKLLLESGSDPEIPDYSGVTVRELLAQKNRTELLP